jgi:hypothetical protein
LNVIYYIFYKTFFLHAPHSTFFFHRCYQSKLSRPLNEMPQKKIMFSHSMFICLHACT